MEGEGDPSGFKGKDQEENISHGRGVFAWFLHALNFDHGHRLLSTTAWSGLMSWIIRSPWRVPMQRRTVKASHDMAANSRRAATGIIVWCIVLEPRYKLFYATSAHSSYSHQKSVDCRSDSQSYSWATGRLGPSTSTSPSSGKKSTHFPKMLRSPTLWSISRVFAELSYVPHGICFVTLTVPLNITLTSTLPRLSYLL